MATSFTDWNPNELYHYGIGGMKWGQRRYQNPDGSLTALGRERYGYTDTGTGGKRRSARGTARDLNKLDQERAEATYRARQVGRLDKVDYLRTKLNRQDVQSNVKKRTKIEGQIKKLTDGMSEKRRAKMEGYFKLAENSKKMTDLILNRAKANGYTIKSKNIQRSVASNRDNVLTILGAIGAVEVSHTMLEKAPIRVGNTNIGLGFAPIFGGSANGKKYKVKNRYA